MVFQVSDVQCGTNAVETVLFCKLILPIRVCPRSRTLSAAEMDRRTDGRGRREEPAADRRLSGRRRARADGGVEKGYRSVFEIIMYHAYSKTRQSNVQGFSQTFF